MHSATTIANIDSLIYRLQSQDPALFRMLDYWGPVNDYNNGDQKTFDDCGTIACLCGTTNLIILERSGIDLAGLGEDFAEQMENQDRAAAWLGMSSDQAAHAFYMDGAPLDAHNDRKSFDLTYLPSERTKAAIQFLINWRDKGIISWDRALRDAGLKPELRAPFSLRQILQTIVDKVARRIEARTA